MNETPEVETFAYMMAAEKMISLLCLMEQTLEFMEEYQIKPDQEVVKALSPLIQKYAKWIRNEKNA